AIDPLAHANQRPTPDARITALWPLSLLCRTSTVRVCCLPLCFWSRSQTWTHKANPCPSLRRDATDLDQLSQRHVRITPLLMTFLSHLFSASPTIMHNLLATK